MAKQVNPEADLAARDCDAFLTSDELATLELVQSLKKTPPFYSNPRSTVLRRYAAGEMICQLNDAGATAFYILSTEDLRRLKEKRFGADPASGDSGDPLRKQWQGDLEGMHAPEAESPSAARRPVATAHLPVPSSRRTRRPGLLGRALRRVTGNSKTADSRRVSIPIDGPTDIDFGTMQSPMYETDVFGEMSCLLHQPRSATVVADRDCYMLEFLRNIFDHIYRDPGYKARADEIYRRRALNGHLRGLEFLRDADDASIERVSQHATLAVVNPGTVLCDEGDVSDCVYIVRTGIVQVLKNVSWRLHPTDVTNWPALVAALVEGGQPAAEEPKDQTEKPEAAPAAPAAAPAAKETPTRPAGLPPKKAPARPLRSPLEFVWQSLPPATRTTLDNLAAAGGSVDETAQEEILQSLNGLICDRTFVSAKEMEKVLQTARGLDAVRNYPKGIRGVKKDWSELECRSAARLVLGALIPHALRRRPDFAGPPRVLDYLSRGDIFGEMGVLSGEKRSATCVAFDHPRDRELKRTGGRIELVRIDADVFRDLLSKSKATRARLARLADERATHQRQVMEISPNEASSPAVTSPEFQELGLIQGQQLLLIDLDRCTRCGECVRACEENHDDGHTRLLLTGPKFDRFLVPLACRQCLDPACLIGCPVGAIRKGPGGEIQIENWCIGCNMCARQCPYDSIQMFDQGIIPEESPNWEFSVGAAGDDDGSRGTGNGMTWTTLDPPTVPDPKDRQKPRPRTPGFHLDHRFRDVMAALGHHAGPVEELQEPVRFRHAFDYDVEPSASRTLRLVAHSSAAGIELALNGHELEYAQDEKQKKRGVLECLLPAEALSRTNRLDVRVLPPVAAEGLMLSLRIDEVPEISLPLPGHEDVDVRLVQERAVVCDLCETRPNREPACVQQCPHEAAIRIDARTEFPVP